MKQDRNEKSSLNKRKTHQVLLMISAAWCGFNLKQRITVIQSVTPEILNCSCEELQYHIVASRAKKCKPHRDISHTLATLNNYVYWTSIKRLKFFFYLAKNPHFHHVSLIFYYRSKAYHDFTDILYYANIF